MIQKTTAFLFFLISFSSYSQHHELMNRLYIANQNINNLIPNKITETKSVVLYLMNSKNTKEELTKLHEKFLTTNIDVVNYIDLNDFLIDNKIKNSFVNYFSEREIKCYSNFHFSMNTKHAYDRKDALKNIPQELVYYEEKHIPRMASWNKQKDYAYVISPHGGGFDCHRTWEALYHKSIPVIERKYHLFSHIDLPILVVDKLEEFLNYSNEKKLNLYKCLTNKYNEKIYMQWWINYINSKCL